MIGKGTTFRTLGASNHADHERQKEDYYATEPAATEWLLKFEQFSGPILEPACGEGHISEVLIRGGYNVTSRDIIDRGYGEVADFLFFNNEKWQGDIVTNPPYSLAQQFIEKALSMVDDGHKVAMFLKLQFLEGKGRGQLFDEQPPVRVWVSRSRLKCAINGDFEHVGGSATAYAWFVWEKGFKGYPEIRWFNP